MENQHRKIKGYRELEQHEIDAVNAIKETGAVVGELIEGLEECAGTSAGPDARWLAIAKTDLQKGFIALTRSVAKPDFF